jgi:hypothetical protein
MQLVAHMLITKIFIHFWLTCLMTSFQIANDVIGPFPFLPHLKSTVIPGVFYATIDLCFDERNFLNTT